jgi:ATP-dependent 26S proteasome regulatory subunit
MLIHSLNGCLQKLISFHLQLTGAKLDGDLLETGMFALRKMSWKASELDLVHRRAKFSRG